MNPALSACVALALPVLSLANTVSDWPTWRGSSGTGSAPGAQPPLKWGDNQNIKWKAPIPGLGFSTPIVWKDRIYLLTAIETNEAGPAVASAAPAPKAPPSPPPGGGEPRGKGGKRGGPPGGGFAGGPNPTRYHEFVVLALDRGTGKIVWTTS